MFDPPLDAPPVLLALAIVAASTLGVAMALAPSPPQDAPSLAAAVDRVAVSPVPTSATHPTSADAIKVEPRRLSTRRGDAEQSSTFVAGRVTPVEPGTRLARVLRGTPARDVFQSPVDMELAAKRARDQPTSWHAAPTGLRVRHVYWGDLDVALVGV